MTNSPTTVEEDTVHSQYHDSNSNNDNSSLESSSEAFDNLVISSTAVLSRIESRLPCPTCKKSVMYFCYYCHQVVGCDRSEIPTLSLPVKLDIIKHAKEKDGKSTAIHAKIIAPEDVAIYTYPDHVPDYKADGRTLLLFPGHDALVVDGTWHQAKGIVRYSNVLNQLPKVMIRTEKTRFWRFQDLAPREYDNLLYYFKFFYDFIQNKYRTTGKPFTRRYQGDYIKY
ncbi:hypothetical protein BDF19DRAFT_443693 [Syncephalis fuscata]|nr:hypothetical protein BDF19DRAFT_443693 [Syncephalis fuscata]